MSCLPSEFKRFAKDIDERYVLALASAGLSTGDVSLEICDVTYERGEYKSEFAAIHPPSAVRVTWNGIASLWACGHALARLAHRMFRAQRAFDASKDDVRLFFQDDEELKLGMNLFELSLILAKHRCDRWVDWAPHPDPQPNDLDSQYGNALFLSALGWIFRHELAHITLGHHGDSSPLPVAKIDNELEADRTATRWIVDGRKADKQRPHGQKPGPVELDLERRALAAFVGLVWISQFECIPHALSTTHPEADKRVANVLEELDLADDSAAAEIFSYGVKALIDPDGKWGPLISHAPTALEAATEAMIRLGRHIRASQ